jgi:hypothetical protein
MWAAPALKRSDEYMTWRTCLSLQGHELQEAASGARLNIDGTSHAIGSVSLLTGAQPSGWSAVTGLVLQDRRSLKGPAAQNAQVSEWIIFFCVGFAGERKI